MVFRDALKEYIDPEWYYNLYLEYFWIGYFNQTRLSRSYLEFNIESLKELSDIGINNVALHLERGGSWAGSNEDTILIKNIGSYYSNDSDAWSHFGSATTLHTFTLQSGETVNIDNSNIESLVNNVLEGSNSVVYLGLVNANENEGGISLKYDNENEIYLSITYTIPTTTAPSAPTNLTANNITKTGCTLSWNVPDGDVDGYYVYKNSINIATVSSTSYNVSGLTVNTSYTFKVSAYNGIGESEKSNSITVTTLPPAPLAPSNLIVTNITCYGCQLSWDAPSGAVDGYRVYVDGDFYGTSSSDSIEIDGLDPSTTYFLSVKAHNSGGDSEMSSIVDFNTLEAPHTPLGFDVFNIVTDDNFRTSFHFGWYPFGYPDDNVFLMYFRVNNGLINTFTLTRDDIPFIMSNLPPNYVYSFILTAYNGSCESEPTDTVYVDTRPTSISAPTNLDFAQLTHTSCTLSWTPPSMYVNGYYVYVMTNTGSVISKISTSSTSYTVTDLNGIYQFAVTAHNCVGESSKSNRLFCQFPLYKSTVIDSIPSSQGGIQTVSEDFSEGNITLYPSPVDNKLYIGGAFDVNVQVFNIDGRILLKAEHVTGEIDVSALPKGTYLVKIEKGNEKVIKKMLKE